MTKDGYTHTNLAAGDNIESVSVVGEQTEVGSSDNVPSSAVIRNANGEEVTDCYDINYVNGTLTVLPLNTIEITAASDEKVYDGTELTNAGYELTGGALEAGDYIDSVTVTGGQKVVGSSENVPSGAVIKNADGEDVTGKYSFVYKNGTLSVTPKQLTITAAYDTKEYDGTALTNAGYTSSDLASGDSFENVNVDGTITTVGSQTNVPSNAKIVNADGVDVTDCYDITYADGTLEVTPKELTITAADDTKEYDGTELTKNSFTNTALASGDRIASVTVTGGQTVVGESNNPASNAKIVNADGEDVTD